jgi:hypothetical protein
MPDMGTPALVRELEVDGRLRPSEAAGFRRLIVSGGELPVWNGFSLLNGLAPSRV